MDNHEQLRAATTKIKVAFADNTTLFRDLMVKQLNSERDIQVMIEVGDGKQLIDTIGKSKSLPDICLIDVVMPVMDGFEAIKIIRKRWPEIKLVALSIYGHSEYVDHMRINGADEYLHKNISPGLLAQSIREVYRNDRCTASLFAATGFQSQAVRDQNVLRQLSPMLMEVWKHACTNTTYSEMAMLLKTTDKSIESCRRKLYHILNVETKTDLCIAAIQYGLVSIGPNGERVWRYVP